MSIATAIQNAQLKVENAYSAVNDKGGTLPEVQNLNNLPDAINSIPAGSGDEIEVLNLTGSTLSVGDKVWIDNQAVSETTTSELYNTNTSGLTTFLTTDGNYLLSGSACWNISTGTATTINPIPTLSDNGNSPVYADNGLVFVDGTMVNTPSPYNPNYGRALGGNFFFTRSGTNCEIRKVDLTDGTILNTYQFTITYDYAVHITWLVLDGVVYFSLYSGADRYGNTYVTVKKSLSATDLTEVLDTKGVLNLMDSSKFSYRQAFYATEDGEFILRFPNYNISSYELTLYRKNNLGVYNAIADINDVCSDMAPYYGYVGSIAFNPISGVLTINNSTGKAAFKYQPETKTFIKLQINIPQAEYFIFCDNEMKTFGYQKSSYYMNCLKIAKIDTSFAAIPYNTTYLRSSAFTGYVTEGGASNEIVKVATTMPEILNVSVTINANDAEISGGIE